MDRLNALDSRAEGLDYYLQLGRCHVGITIGRVPG